MSACSLDNHEIVELQVKGLKDFTPAMGNMNFHGPKSQRQVRDYKGSTEVPGERKESCLIHEPITCGGET